MIPFSVNGAMELFGPRRHERLVVPFAVNGQFPSQVVMQMVAPPGAMGQGVPATGGPPSSGGAMVGGPANANAY
jgi:hypothetical protein